MAGKGLLVFNRWEICLKADCNVKREVRESFGERWKEESVLREGRCDKPSKTMKKGE